MDTIAAQQLCKSYRGVFRLGPLDLRVAPGEVLGIMGPNGAGKTTLLRLLWGFIRPDAGSISVFGLQPHLEQVKVRLKAGFLSENPAMYDSLTARQMLQFVSRFYGRWDSSWTDVLLDRFSVNPDLKTEKLSRGNRVKLGLISALGHHPALLILDEPTAGLDPLVRVEILQFLRKMAREEGVSILLSSHISDDLDQIADSVLMLNNGQIVEYARAAFLVEKYNLQRLEAIFVHAIGAQHRPQRLV
jgi:ABC-2 type transport system ATP-binding protein